MWMGDMRKQCRVFHFLDSRVRLYCIMYSKYIFENAYGIYSSIPALSFKKIQKTWRIEYLTFFVYTIAISFKTKTTHDSAIRLQCSNTITDGIICHSVLGVRWRLTKMHIIHGLEKVFHKARTNLYYSSTLYLGGKRRAFQLSQNKVEKNLAQRISKRINYAIVLYDDKEEQIGTSRRCLIHIYRSIKIWNIHKMFREWNVIMTTHVPSKTRTFKLSPSAYHTCSRL